MDTKLHSWFNELNDREKLTVLHAISYDDYYDAAGIPGHNQFMLIAKLAEMLEFCGVTAEMLNPKAED